MKKQVNNAALFVLLFAFALIPAGCGEGELDGNYFATRLRGTWETLNPEPYDYAGMLVIDYTTITITGYEKNLYIPDDPRRPFKDITKGVSRKGYTEDGKMYINDFGWKEGISYTYERGTSSNNYTDLLQFNFEGRSETLWKIEE
ncbi:MAG: hypothetical protein LBK18_01655 [Prevotellaceae bacterium]|jgi:hypothetical protein|nr:hypothetical protein [Prevotellaceae bacterium]